MKFQLVSVIAVTLGAAAAAPAIAATNTLVYSVTPSTLTADDSAIEYSGAIAENGGVFANYWEFVVPAGGLDISITAQDTVTNLSQLLKSTTLYLYLCKSNCMAGTSGGNGAPGAIPTPDSLVASDSVPTLIGASQYWNLGSLTSLLLVIGGDDYFIELAGKAGTGDSLKLGITGDIATTTVPEPTTWAMMLIGFTGLGAMCRRRARKDRLAPAFA